MNYQKVTEYKAIIKDDTYLISYNEQFYKYILYKLIQYSHIIL